MCCTRCFWSNTCDCLIFSLSICKTFCLALAGTEDENRGAAKFDPLEPEAAETEGQGTLPESDLKTLRDFLRSTK